MTETTTDGARRSTGERHEAQYDRLSSESLSVSVATAVATVRGVPVTELEPLHYTIDTDALERLFEPRSDGLRSGGRVTFEYAGCDVTVTASGQILVEESTTD